MNTAKQIAQLRDRLIQLESNPVGLNEAASDLLKVFGFGSRAVPQVAKVLRQGAQAVLRNEKYVLKDGQWLKLDATGKYPTNIKATAADADELTDLARQNPKMLLHPEAEMLKPGATVTINNDNYILQNGEWFEQMPGSKVLRKATPEEAHAAESAALKNPKNRNAVDPAQQQQSGAAAGAAAEESFTQELAKKYLYTSASDPEQVKASQVATSRLIRMFVHGVPALWEINDAVVKYKNGDLAGAYKSGGAAILAAASGFIPIKYTLGGALTAGFALLLIKTFAEEPLTDEEKKTAEQLASTYYHLRKPLDPSRNGKPPIPPRLWDTTKRLYDQYQDQQKNPPIDGGPGNAPAPAAAVPAKAATAPVAPPSAPAAPAAPAEPTPAQLQQAAGIPTKAEPPAPAAEPPAPSKPGRLKFS